MKKDQMIKDIIIAINDDIRELQHQLDKLRQYICILEDCKYKLQLIDIYDSKYLQDEKYAIDCILQINGLMRPKDIVKKLKNLGFKTDSTKVGGYLYRKAERNQGIKRYGIGLYGRDNITLSLVKYNKESIYSQIFF